MVDGVTIGLILAAVAGGAFGAAIGALPAFTFTGVLVIVGETLAIARTEGATGTVAGVDVTATIAFGPAFGPHVSFGGGAAAVAYAAKRGYIEPEFEYHPAKYITTGLGMRPDVLLVGGLFGVLGHLVFTVSQATSLPWDPVAFGVVVSAFAHRIAMGYTVVGNPAGGWWDMTPFERSTRRRSSAVRRTEKTTDGGADRSRGSSDRAFESRNRQSGSTGRSVVEPWLAHQYQWTHVIGIGIVAGLLGAFIAFQTGSAFLAFGISAASLAFMTAGVDRIPVTHHITLPASTIVLAVVPATAHQSAPVVVAGSIGLGEALVLGALIGVIGALLGELAQRVCYAHAETHFDPPAASIVLTTLLIALLSFAGVLPHAAWIPVP